MKERKDQIFQAVVLSIVAYALFSATDAARKYLTISYDVFDVLFWQAIIGLICLLAASPWIGGMRSLYRSGAVRWHVVRGILMAANTALSLMAISHVPLMDAYTIYFTTPFVVSLLSWALFKEAVGPVRLISIGCGFIGALIAFRPGFAALDPAYLYACACVFAFGLSGLVAKKIGAGSHMLSFGVYPLALVIPVCLVMKGGDMLYVPDMNFLMMSIFIGSFYAAALVMVAMGYTKAEAALVAPFHYTQLIWALVAGYIVFGDVPDFFKLLGATIIVGSGVVFFMREHVRNMREKKALRKVKGQTSG